MPIYYGKPYIDPDLETKFKENEINIEQWIQKLTDMGYGIVKLERLRDPFNVGKYPAFEINYEKPTFEAVQGLINPFISHTNLMCTAPYGGPCLCTV